MAAAAPRTGAPSPAVAPPPGNPRFPLFDSLRGVAVLAVVVFHVFLVTGALNRNGLGDVVTVLGSLAPILFFTLSGFLLYRPSAAARAAGRRAPPASRYARRRTLRILPAYWLALTALAVFPGVVGVFSGDWWRYYLFLQLYDETTFSRGIPVAWTLCVEVTFYLALPLLTLGLRRARLGRAPDAWARGELAGLAALAAVGLVVQVAAARQDVSHLVSQALPGQCTWFALGMALAVISVAEPHPERRWRSLRLAIERPWLCWSGAALAFTALAIVRGPTGGLFGIVEALRTEQPYAKALADVGLTALLTTLIMLPAAFEGRGDGMPRRVLASAPLAWLGVISYGVYLWHLTVAELIALPGVPQHFPASGLDLAGRIPNGATPVVLVLTLVATCVLAAASYRFVELPFLRRKER